MKRSKYDWAENNQEEARRIAERATNLIKTLHDKEMFEGYFKRFYYEPLEVVINSYQPSESWKDVIKSNDKMHLALSCKGYGSYKSSDCIEVYGSPVKVSYLYLSLLFMSYAFAHPILTT